jgi:hypothetical protein
LPAVTYLSKKRPATAGDTSPGLRSRTCTGSPGTMPTRTVPPGDVASIAFFSRLARIE